MNSFSNNIEEYWEEVKDQYDIDFEEFKKVCKNVFTFIKETISSGVGKNIRIKYLGVFEVSKSRAKYCKKSLEKNLEKGVISQERYDKRMKILDNYV